MKPEYISRVIRFFNKWWQHSNSAFTPMTCFPYLGAEITRLREAKGLTPQNLAQLVGVRETTILNLEAGRFFKADLLERILSSLGCHLMIAQDNANSPLECAENKATYLWTQKGDKGDKRGIE